MSEWSLTDDLLESYIKTFYGHGSYEAEYWFIGMEFGGGTSLAEIVSRIQGWADRGGNELEDVVGPEGGGSKWFRPPFPLQPTWAKLIRVVLNAHGHIPTSEMMRAYQKNELGRVGGRDCILELLPLPSPGLGSWMFYPEYSRLRYLRDREIYTNHVAPGRIAHLQHRIEEHKPRAVIFYGAGYQHWWNQIAGVEFKPASIAKVLVGRNAETLFISMHHPTAFGVKSHYFDSIGRLIGEAARS